MAALRDPDLDTVLGRPAKVLAQAEGPDGSLLVGTRESLALRRDGEWQVWGWHEIERGSWKSESGIFRFWSMDGEKFEVLLEQPLRLPDLIQERVQAATVQTYHYELEPGQLRIVVRRPLDGSSKVRFYAAASGGASLADPRVAELAVQETDRIKQEYDFD